MAGAESAVALQLLQDRERGSQKLVSRLPYTGLSVLHCWARSAVESRVDGTCLNCDGGCRSFVAVCGPSRVSGSGGSAC